MYQDRRALIIGSCKGVEDTLSPQRVNGLIKSLSRTISTKEKYNFQLIKTPDDGSSYFYNKMKSDIIASLDECSDVGDESLLYIHFIGHSISHGTDDLGLFLGRKKSGDDSYYPVSDLISEVKKARFKNLIFVIDGCHSSRGIAALKYSGINYFGMNSSEKYSFNGNFTESLIKTLDSRIQKSDQRIDRQAGGITLRRIFEATRANIRELIEKGGQPQSPGSDGNLADTVILETPPLLVNHYNLYASSRSIYGRIYKMISIIGNSTMNDQELYLACQKSGGFVIRRKSKDESHTYVSKERFADYTDFLVAAELVVKPAGLYQLTDFGKKALNGQVFNKYLLEAIERNVFPEWLDFQTLDKTITQLLANLIPPTPSKIEERLRLVSEQSIAITPRIRFALQILPSTGRFLKGSADALFMAEV